MRLREGVVLVTASVAATAWTTPAHALTWAWQADLGYASASHAGSYASYYGDETNKGFTAGARGRLAFSPVFSIEQGIRYAQKGSGYAGSITYADPSGPMLVYYTITLSRELDYVELPLLLRASLPTHGVWTPYVLGGGALGFLTRASTHYEGAGVNVNGDLAGYRARDWSAVFGLGTTIGERAVRATLEVRYTLGLVNVLDDGSGLEAKNRDLSVMLGVGFVPERAR